MKVNFINFRLKIVELKLKYKIRKNRFSFLNKHFLKLYEIIELSQNV